MSKPSPARRLAIGTAQFGLPYGVANQTGQVSAAEGAAILSRGRAAGIDTIDTAIAYGDSEARLGAIGIAGWKVVTKLPAIPDLADIGEWVRDAVKESRRRLGTDRLHGLLLHRPGELLGPRGREIFGALAAVRDEGIVEKVGYSIYEPAELDSLAAAFPPDIVQAPFNAVNRSIVESGWARRLADAGAELHVRSIFLQGLLVMPSGARPPRFARWEGLWRAWEEWLARVDATALEACVAFALAHAGIDRVVVGVDAVSQLDEIVAATERRMAPADFPDAIRSDDPQLINPANWAAS